MAQSRSGRRRFLLSGAGSGLLAFPLATTAAQRADKAPTGSRQYHRYVAGPYGQLHATITDPSAGRAERTPVLCLPMSPRSGRDFDEFALTLADRRRVIAPDVPGFGGSDPPPTPPRIEDYAQAILASLDQLLGARVKVDLVGQHTGAAIALAMARVAPKRVRRLATIGVPLFSAEERARLSAQFVRPRPYFDDPEFLCRTWQRDAAAMAAGQPSERMLLRFTEIMRAGTRSHWGFRAVFEFDTRTALRDLPTPMLSIVLQENLAAASREAARLVRHGDIADLTDLPGSALDFAHERLAQTCRDFFDR